MSRSTTTKKRRLEPSKKPWIPLPYMKRAVKFLLEHCAAGLLLDPGLRKTSITLAAFSYLKKRKLANKMLVIAPLRPAYLVWPAEVEKWDDFRHLKIVVLHGRHKEALLREEADVYVINPEGLDWLIGQRSAREFKALGFDTLVVDELTKFKKATGKRFKLLKRVLDTFMRRWGLTGTPAPNGLIDLFGQMYVLDLGNALGRFITHYRIMYFINPDKMGWKWVPQEGAEELIYERLKPLCIRMEAGDYLELPKMVPHKIMIPWPDSKTRALYDTVEEDMIGKLDGELIVASNAAAASTKCRQICNGAVYIDDDIAGLVRGKKRTVLDVHDAKLDALEELVNELNGSPLLLAYEFHHDLDRIRKRFPNVPVIAGKSMKEMQRIEAAWNAGDIPLLPGQPASIGHGLNLQEGNAQHVGWYGMFWDMELVKQFLDRVLRSGNKSARVFQHFFMMEDSTDVAIYWAQQRKQRTQQALSDALKDLRALRREGKQLLPSD